MNLHLNPNLAQHLLAYDKTYKKVAVQAEKPKRTRTATHLGEVNATHLFPYLAQVGDRVNTRRIDQAIAEIQAADNLEDRWSLMDESSILIYNYRKCWVAARILYNVPGDFIYEFTWLWPDTESSHKHLDFTPGRCMLRHAFGSDDHLYPEDERIEPVKIGRRKFRRFHMTLSATDVKHCDTANWKLGCMTWHRNTSNLRAMCRRFESALAERLPQYNGAGHDSNVFTRVVPGQDTPDWILKYHYNFHHVPSPEKATIEPKHLIGALWKRVRRSGDDQEVPEIFTKPFILREATAALKHIRALHPTTNDVSLMLRPVRLLEHYMEMIYSIQEIYPECPVDYFQNYKTDLLHYEGRYDLRLTTKGREYLRTNMPVKSLFENISKGWRSAAQGMGTWQRHHHTEHGILRVRSGIFQDAMNMLDHLLLDDHEPAKPKRWTAQHMHDTWMQQRWKITTPNEALPQDLFPEPVKIETTIGKMTIIQPRDIHMLAEWGRAVRNCVGGGSYADRVKKKQHFILLFLLDNKPRFTAALTLDQGTLSVEQIADIGNGRLSTTEYGITQACIQSALNQRSTQL